MMTKQNDLKERNFTDFRNCQSASKCILSEQLVPNMSETKVKEPHKLSRIMHFTLTELMIVIGIIVILVSLLLPALTKARQTAQKISCVGNLKQIAIAVDGYSCDYEGWLPLAGIQGMVEKMNWVDATAKYLDSDSHWNYGWPSDTGNAVRKIYQCPSGNVQIKWGLNYMYHKRVGSTSDRSSTFAPLKKIKVSKPSYALLLVDGENSTVANFRFRIAYTGTYQPFPEDISYRHRTGSNLLFVDAHVDWERFPWSRADYVVSWAWLDQ